MTRVTLARLDARGADRDQLVRFLTSERFPFHVASRPDRATVLERIDRGDFDERGRLVRWVRTDGADTVGLLRVEDADDPTPMLDLRLGEAHRGRGLGTAALRRACDLVFGTLPDVDRFEGSTRSDNVAMRRAFRRAGWVKEAVHREAWPGRDGARFDAIGYAMLRGDWQRGTVTPVRWTDEID